MKNFNLNHPERKDGETFLGNTSRLYPGEVLGVPYTALPYTSKRKGVKAYNALGEELTGMVPVFVNQKEYDEKVNKIDTPADHFPITA